MRIKIVIFIFLLLLISSIPLTAGGAQESSDRGEYLAAQGGIIPPDEVRVDSYISKINYHYPDTADPLGVTFLSEYDDLSSSGEEIILQVGIQGRRSEFKDLPPLNIIFVFDNSGSMGQEHKIEWVREGMRTLLGRIRDIDVLSVVAYSDTAEVLLPAAAVGYTDKDEIMTLLEGSLPYGTADHQSGLELGIEQAKKYHASGGVSRILFLSDGLGGTDDLLPIVQNARDEGIGISTIGVGLDYNQSFMVTLARSGGGSSRFLSKPEKIEDVFHTGFARMVVPEASELEMVMNFMPGVEILNTWGYDHQIEDDRITFSQPTVHSQDYETILVHIQTPSNTPVGLRTLANFVISYTDTAGRVHGPDSYVVDVNFKNSIHDSRNFSDQKVLISRSVLDAALAIKDIGNLYNSIILIEQEVNILYTASNMGTSPEVDSPMQDDLQQNIADYYTLIRLQKQRCFDLSVFLKRQLTEVHLVIEEEIFASEITIFDNYIKRFGGELSVSPIILDQLVSDQ